jgi:Skp family chaperone for outer membrane proteins
MRTNLLRVLAPGLFAASAIVLAANAGAQTPPPAAPPTAAKSPQAAPMAGHHKNGHAGATPHADMKAECQAMMARKQEMQAKLATMDATLDRLVAEMNAANASKAPDALEKPMAAVLAELVAQSKASRSMMMEMQPGMMAHVKHHMDTRGTKGAMDCPMMKTGATPEAKPAATSGKM